MCKVSILIPVFNAEKYLAEAIDSIITQTFQDWELLIINDGSTDSSKTIIETYTDPRIRHIENERNLGLIRTLNKGILLCNGQYIARMDADDISMPKRLAEQVQFMDNNIEYVLCGANAIVIDSKGTETGKIINPSSNSLLQISLLFTNPFIHPSILVRKEVMKDNLFDKEWLHVEDYELWTRLATTGKMTNIKQPLLKYRWHDSNVSNIYSEVQEHSKNKIIKLQLEKLSIIPTEKDLELHRVTFNLYTLGQKNKINTKQFKEINEWFAKLREQNKLKQVYSQSDLEAFLWSRWIVLCISQGAIGKVFLPRFISFTPNVVYKTMQLIAYLRKK